MSTATVAPWRTMGAPRTWATHGHLLHIRALMGDVDSTLAREAVDRAVAAACPSTLAYSLYTASRVRPARGPAARRIARNEQAVGLAAPPGAVLFEGFALANLARYEAIRDPAAGASQRRRARSLLAWATGRTSGASPGDHPVPHRVRRSGSGGSGGWSDEAATRRSRGLLRRHQHHVVMRRDDLGTDFDLAHAHGRSMTDDELVQHLRGVVDALAGPAAALHGARTARPPRPRDDDHAVAWDDGGGRRRARVRRATAGDRESAAMVDQLSPMEAIMWRVGQDPMLRMTVGALMILDHAPEQEALVERLAQLADDAPRLRRRPDESTPVRPRPVWIDDGHSVGRQLRAVAGRRPPRFDAPGARPGRAARVGAVRSRPFAMGRHVDRRPGGRQGRALPAGPPRPHRRRRRDPAAGPPGRRADVAPRARAE